jgi:DNA polymerase III delta prime subunit
MIEHHALLLCVPEPLVYEIEASFATAPYVTHRFKQLGIDEVRQLTNDAYRRPEGDADLQLLVVATEFITEEAQQALLKVVEEPPMSTRFLFVVPIGYTLVPTLESRFYRVEGTSRHVLSAVFSAFQSASLAERLACIEDVLKRKDHAWQADLKRGLVEYLIKTSHLRTQAERIDLEYIARLLLTRGASNKFLLEQLALVLPT